MGLPVLSGRLSAEQLVFGEWSFDYLNVESGKSTARNLDVVVEVQGGNYGDSSLGDGEINVTGELQNAILQLEWRLDGYAANVGIQFALLEEEIHGTIDTASLSEPISGTWTLQNPTEFSLGPTTQSLAAGSWSNDEAELRHEEFLRRPESVSIVAALLNVPLNVLDVFLPDTLRLQGRVDASIDLQHGVDGWNGSLDWLQRNTVAQFIVSEDDRYDGEVPEARATVQVVNNAATIHAALKTRQGTEATLDASLSEPTVDADVIARFQLTGNHWDWVPQVIPEIDEFAGSISADVHASGMLLSPNLQGEVQWLNGALAVPGLNLPLQDIDVTLTGSSAGDMTVSGTARAGEGILQVRGGLEDILSASPAFEVTLTGDQANLLNWEDYLLIASPDLEFSGGLDGVRVNGTVNLDKAEINLRELPEGAVMPSDDVIVEGREIEARRRTRVSGEIEFMLSESIHIQAFGLDTNLEGQLRFIMAEDRAPQGLGELRLVGGVFEAYGQKLEIDTGSMIFTGPLDDPLINVRAVRTIESGSGTIVVGIELRGRARNVNSSLFSDPSMSQADTLSYLVIGRPLEDASASDGNTLSNTAFSLGLRQAELITAQIGQTVGLDELRVSGNNQNTTELIAGKQINSRLYARYAYGVFSRVGKLLMRYKLSESFSIEIAAGENQSMDILYTVEKE